MYIIQEWAGNKQSGFTKGAVAKSSHICSSTFWIERFIRRRMPLSVLVCICFNFCSVNEHWFEFNLADFRKLLNKSVKKPFCTSVHVFSKTSCYRGMIRCRFVLQQPHKPDVGFARFFYSSARENSSHVCIYNNRKHDLRINLSPPPAIIGMQFSVIWFFRNLCHFKYRTTLPELPGFVLGTNATACCLIPTQCSKPLVVAAATQTLEWNWIPKWI